jgi:YHS domain-containing protein
MTREAVKDPICGREVDPLRARAVGIFGGVTYYFCSADCKGQFADPRKTPRPEGPPSPSEAHEMLASSQASSPPAASMPSALSIASASDEVNIDDTDKVAALPPPGRPRIRLGLLITLLVVTALLVSLAAHLTRR